MSARKRVQLPVLGGVRPKAPWKVARALVQSLAFIAVLLSPLLGGWQRLDKNHLATWNGHGHDLPGWLLESLPLGEAPAQAHSSNLILGGGATGEYFAIPFVDPVAGVLTLATAQVSALMLLAWGLPVLLALLLGRAFCGWMCPFGTLSRLLQALMLRLPLHPRPRRIPRARFFRWVVLAVCVVTGVAGFQLLTYLLLPHSLMQQAAYSVWLLGGGGAVLGWLLGLIAAGLFLGPTIYCSTICPTGSSLALLGKVKLTRTAIADTQACGSACELCSRACWLHLDPASGDPGPDCDTCGRCARACPHDNLIFGFQGRAATTPSVEGAKKGSSAIHQAARSLGVLLFGVLLLVPGDAMAQVNEGTQKPRLIMDSAVEQADVTVSLAVVDVNGVRLNADNPNTEHGTKLSVSLVRGKRLAADERGKLGLRPVYEGPLQLLVQRQGEVDLSIDASEPNAPMSAARRAIYRKKIPGSLSPGDSITLQPIAGWLDRALVWKIPEQSAGSGSARLPLSLLASFLVFLGLLSLSLAFTKPSKC